MKKILLSIAVLAGLTASAQTATNSDISGNNITETGDGYSYYFNTAPGLGQDVLSCTDAGALFNTFSSGSVGTYGVDSVETTGDVLGNGFLTYSFSGATTSSNVSQGANRFQSGNCSQVGGVDVSANKTIKARVKSTVDLSFTILAASDAGGWYSHDGALSFQSVVGGADWTVVEFAIADANWQGNGDLEKVIGWELYFADAQTFEAGELHFDWILFGDAEDVTSTNEVVATGFNVFPNPATDILNVNFDATSATTIELVDLTGKVVATQIAQAGSVTASFATADVNAGIYFVNVKNANGSTTQKVVIK
jgi:hypothetical protein